MINEYEQTVIGSFNEYNNYSMSFAELSWLIMLHSTANEHTRELIEERLTDINYHSICSAISKQNYREALTLYDFD